MAEHRVFLLTLEGDGWVLKEHASGKVVGQFRSKGEGERFARLGTEARSRRAPGRGRNHRQHGGRGGLRAKPQAAASLVQ
jgi:hypothetical protein